MAGGDEEIARQGRQAALAIVAGGLLAVFAPTLVRLFGLAPRYEMLFYLISLAAFIWSLFVTYGIWQKRRK